VNEEESAKIEKRGLGFFVCGSKIWDLGSVDCGLLGPRHCVCVCVTERVKRLLCKNSHVAKSQGATVVYRLFCTKRTCVLSV